MLGYESLILDEPYVVKTTHFFLFPDCFVGVVALKHGDPHTRLVIDERLKIWSVPLEGIQVVEKKDWPEWAEKFILSASGS